MPVHRIGFMLKPDGFFHSNPAMDLPPSDHACGCEAGACACVHSNGHHMCG